MIERAARVLLAAAGERNAADYIAARALAGDFQVAHLQILDVAHVDDLEFSAAVDDRLGARAVHVVHDGRAFLARGRQSQLLFKIAARLEQHLGARRQIAVRHPAQALEGGVGGQAVVGVLARHRIHIIGHRLARRLSFVPAGRRRFARIPVRRLSVGGAAVGTAGIHRPPAVLGGIAGGRVSRGVAGGLSTGSRVTGDVAGYGGAASHIPVDIVPGGIRILALTARQGQGHE